MVSALGSGVLCGVGGYGVVLGLQCVFSVELVGAGQTQSNSRGLLCKNL